MSHANGIWQDDAAAATAATAATAAATFSMIPTLPPLPIMPTLPTLPTLPMTLRLLFTALLLLALSGCGLLKRDPKPAAAEWKSLTLVAAADANANSALAVDVVLIKDKAMLESLAAMPAARYFAGRADLQRTFPDALTVLSIEITPGQMIQLDSKRFKDQAAWAALAFANYANPGEHRARLLLNNNGYLLQLNAQGMVAIDVALAPAR